jgi:CheY-like chemotaxis protein
LYFPRVAAPATAASSAPVEHETPATETILVVVDEKAVRDLTVRILKKIGHTVLAAANGAEAVEVSQAFPGSIALLLTDVVMPNMSGRQVADELLRTRPDMKVLYLSGYTDNTVVHHGVLEDGVEFLPKPFSREALAKKIRDVLSSHPPANDESQV